MDDAFSILFENFQQATKGLHITFKVLVAIILLLIFVAVISAIVNVILGV